MATQVPSQATTWNACTHPEVALEEEKLPPVSAVADQKAGQAAGARGTSTSPALSVFPGEDQVAGAMAMNWTPVPNCGQ